MMLLKAIKPMCPNRKLIAVLICSTILVPFCACLTAAAQSTNQVSSGTSQRTTVNFSNTFGLYTQLNTTPNVAGSVNAVLNVEPGSTIKSDFGGISSELKQSVNVTPTSSSVSIEGMKSVNEYRIAPGTTFSSDMKTLSASDCAASPACTKYADGPAVGSSGSGMQHVMTLTIDQTTSTFSNSFSQNF